MMRWFVIFLCWCVCGQMLWGRAVTSTEAQTVAMAWLTRNAAFVSVEPTVTSSIAVPTKDGSILYYGVHVGQQELVIVAGDTRIEPILAVVSTRNSKVPSSHPLSDLLLGDTLNRKAVFVDNAKVSAEVQACIDAHEQRWAALLNSSPTNTIAPQKKPFVLTGWETGGRLTHWYQASFNRYAKWAEGEVYDRYTPNHTLTGCVATAGAAVLQYFNIPTGPTGITKPCHLEGQPLPLSTFGGRYDWQQLPETWRSKTELSEDAKELLGRVSYDVGVCVYTWYSKQMSGSAPSTLAWALPAFGIQTTYVKGQPDKGQPQLVAKTHIYEQVMKGAPVVLGLMGRVGGHAALAVGYGEDCSAVPYTRLFMGWGGWYDTWYALPDPRFAGETFTLLRDAVTELTPPPSPVDTPTPTH